MSLWGILFHIFCRFKLDDKYLLLNWHECVSKSACTWTPVKRNVGAHDFFKGGALAQNKMITSYICRLSVLWGTRMWHISTLLWRQTFSNHVFPIDTHNLHILYCGIFEHSSLKGKKMWMCLSLHPIPPNLLKEISYGGYSYGKSSSSLQ